MVRVYDLNKSKWTEDAGVKENRFLLSGLWAPLSMKQSFQLHQDMLSAESIWFLESSWSW